MNYVIGAIVILLLGFFLIKNIIAIVNEVKEKKLKKNDLIESKKDSIENDKKGGKTE